MALRICVLTSVHPRDDVRIFHREAKSLMAAGFDVSMIVADGKGDACKSSIIIRDVGRPTGSRVHRGLRAAWKIFKEARRTHADVFILHDPELLPVGIALALAGRSVLYDVHENVPHQILQKAWIPRLLRPLVSAAMRAVEWVAARILWGVIGATPQIAARFPPATTQLVQNFPVAAEFAQALAYQDRPAYVVYAGSITRIRGVAEMVEAMGRVDAGVDARLVLAGTFTPPELAQEVQALQGWRRAEYVGLLGRADVAALIGSGRVGMITAHVTRSHVDAWPIKMFEYMAAGTPVVCSNFDQFRQIVERHGCGLCVDPHDPDAIAVAIEWLLRHPREAEEMGARGREAVRAQFNWDVQAQGLISFIMRREKGVT